MKGDPYLFQEKSFPVLTEDLSKRFPGLLSMSKRECLNDIYETQTFALQFRRYTYPPVQLRRPYSRVGRNDGKI